MKRLYKSTKDRKVFGVCAGIAEYFNIDPTLVRLITLILFIAYGSGLLAYLVAALILPDATAEVYKDVESIENEN